jgi:hypothetical protein
MGYGLPFALCVRWLGRAVCGGPMPGGGRAAWPVCLISDPLLRVYPFIINSLTTTSRSAFDPNLESQHRQILSQAQVDPRSEAITRISLLLSTKCGCQNGVLSTNWWLELRSASAGRARPWGGQRCRRWISQKGDHGHTKTDNGRD